MRPLIKRPSVIRYAFIALSLVWPASSRPAGAEENIRLHTLSAKLPSLKLDGSEVPMFGKWSSKMLKLENHSNSQRIWIKKAVIRVIDEETGKENQDFFCHFHIGGNGYESYDKMRFLGAHAGNNSMEFPDGFAVPMTVSPKEPLYLFGMAADYAHRNIHKSVHFEVTIDYYDDAAAQKLRLKELEFQFVVVKSTTIESVNSFKELARKAANQHNAYGDHLHHSAYANSIHWFAPPGKHEYRTKINDQIFGLRKGDVRVHYIHLHLHSYGDYGEIYDATEKRTVWRGYAKTYPDRSVLEKIDRYASKEGFILKKNHSYEAIAVYDNPTGKDISAMLTMRMFYRLENGNRSP